MTITTSVSEAPEAPAGAPVRLRAEAVRLAYGDRVVVDSLDLDVLGGTITAVIGPNGCGKSTLLRALGRLMKTRGGHVLLDGKRIDRMSTRQVATVLGVLPQADRKSVV